MTEIISLIIQVTPSEEELCCIATNVICDEPGCNRTFPNSSSLYFHKSQYHKRKKIEAKIKNLNVEWFYCPVESCIYHKDFVKGKHFAKYKYVKQHYLKVHAKRTLNCSECDKTFSTTSLLTAHLKSCGLKLLCSCGQQFGSVEALQSHTRIKEHEMTADTITAIKQRKQVLSKNTKKIKRPTVSPKLCIALPMSSGSSISNGLPSLVPSTQPLHMMAAIALSELAATNQKISCVDIGVQTDDVNPKRSARKISVSGQSRKTSSRICRRWKQTAEIETQTRLTNRDSKKRKNLFSDATTKKSISISTGGETPIQSKAVLQNRVYNVGIDTNANGTAIGTADNYLICSNILVNSNLTENCRTYQTSIISTSTQTSPRCDKKFINESEVNGWSLNLLQGTTTSEPLAIVSTSTNTDTINDIYDDSTTLNSLLNNDTLNMNCELHNPCQQLNCSLNTQQNTTAHFSTTETSSYGEISGADYGLEMGGDTAELSNVVDGPSAVAMPGKNNTHQLRAPPLGQIRSSSIETQTEHDVFWSSNTDTDMDDMLGSPVCCHTEHHTSSVFDTCLCDSIGRGDCPCQKCSTPLPPSLCSTSQTQTCEDFSAIEQFLCSNIDTQTHANDLFPEFSFADTQTQTGFDEFPSFVTSETQT